MVMQQFVMDLLGRFRKSILTFRGTLDGGDGIKEVQKGSFIDFGLFLQRRPGTAAKQRQQ